MNRRSFLTSIPAAIVGLTSAKAATGSQAPSIAPAVVYEVPPGSYVTPAMAWHGTVPFWGADTGPEVLHFPADGVAYSGFSIVADQDIGVWIVSDAVLQVLADLEASSGDASAAITELTASIDALVEAMG